MAAWFRDAELRTDERLLFRRAANLSQGWRAVGGELSVTDQRILFVPNWLEARSGGRAAEVERSAPVVATVLRPGSGRAGALGGLFGRRPGRVELTTAGRTYRLGIAESEALVELLSS